MSDIKALDSLSGTISGGCEIAGNLCVTKEYDAYAGSYDIVPKAFQSQTLETKDRVMKQDLHVEEVPYWETSNDANGKTAYIASEIQANQGE